LRKDFNIDFKKVEKGFLNFDSEINYLGRWQVVSKRPIIILDSAHNEAGITYAIKTLSSYKNSQIHFVLGFVNDKDINKILSLFPKESNYYFCKADIPRGLNREELKIKCESLGLKGSSYPSVKSAYRAAIKKAKSDDVIYVGGSIFVTGEVI
jgi:dihydrofolate synthase/folylpolyglutamate synthase